MSVSVQVLFERPQTEIASQITDRLSKSVATSIVTGFATPGGLAAIARPIGMRPTSLSTLVVGAATYPGFEALDDLLTAGVPPDRLFVHLGHTTLTGTNKNPFARYHPMLHSKVYYMELPDSEACAFIGSHNVTSFALTGLNGEAAVLLEGSVHSPEFESVRKHIAAARAQAVAYSPSMKEAYTWWMREFLDGLRAEIGLPQDWMTVRTILVFAEAPKGALLPSGDQIYFEIPSGIEQIESLKTETHLFLFDSLPAGPWEALRSIRSANSAYRCTTLGAENKQGNLEVTANWRIEGTARPLLRAVSSGTLRPNTLGGMQQVRAEIVTPEIAEFEYLFELDRGGWDPEFAELNPLHSPSGFEDAVVTEASGNGRAASGWKLVTNLRRREGKGQERDAAALRLASPDSGSFTLVSLRRRRKTKADFEEEAD